MTKTVIYYFSGTGNSLHVAKELEKRIPNIEVIPILRYLNLENIKSSADNVGFIFPIYMTNIPAPMRKFIQKLDLSLTKYIFMVATRIGTFTIASTLLKQMLKKKEKKLNSYFILNMAQNSPTGLRPGKGDEDWVERMGPKELARIERTIQDELDNIAKIVINKEHYPKNSKTTLSEYLSYLFMHMMTRNTKSEIGYIVDDSCISCGTCEKVCLSGKINLSGGKPHWQKNVQCYYCFACFNFCPQQAILVRKKYTRNDGRYHHPNIKVNDIADQKKA
jgi:formate hydrogenlyase subunit 6/NADH:ubiquinone oxidoreductase subunit I/flavodoxin